MLRAVLDTNVVLAAQKANSAASPNLEIISRWKSGEFVWLNSEGILTEYLEKLLEHGFPADKASRFVALVARFGERVSIAFFHIHRYPEDSDDVIFLLTALNGAATHLVTYDGHLGRIAWNYSEFKTCPPLVFLEDLRAHLQP